MLASCLAACTAGGGQAEASGEESGDATSTETGDTTGTVEEPEPAVEWPTLDCDPLVPSFCGYPWPNNVFTTPDAESPTGRRLHFSEAMLPKHTGLPTDPAPYEQVDGFSPGGFIHVQLPGATRTGVATDRNIERSLESDSPTVIIDAETGEWIPHFVDIDSSTDDDAQRSFSLFPARRLQDDHRYIVAIREVVDVNGEALAPSSAFAALRDLTTWEPEAGFEAAAVEDRRPLYADIFMRLDQAGVAREDLQLAWDFTTQSTADQTQNLVHMRDEALAMGPIDYTVRSVRTDDYPDEIMLSIEGRMTVPLYTTDEKWGGVLNYGPDGLPEPTGTKEVDWYLMIPNSAATAPAAIVQHGHGLFGSRDQIEASNFRTFMNEYNYAFFAVDWTGMAGDDGPRAALVLDQGELEDFQFMMDRLQQGILESLLAMRMFKDDFSQDADYGQYLDPSKLYYYGISEGGILGGVYMALTTDVTRGCLGVPGQPYNLLLTRSVDFDFFFDIAKSRIKDGRDIQLMLGMVQLLWNRAEPLGFTNHIIDDRFEGTPEHEVFLRAAIGDHQVTTLGAHHMARSIGATHLDTGIRDIFELPQASGSASGAVYVEYDFGLPEDPACNIPPTACDDPHGKLRKLTEARDQLDQFFRTGVVENLCADGVCSFADQSGCEPGEEQPGVCAEVG